MRRWALSVGWTHDKHLLRMTCVGGRGLTFRRVTPREEIGQLGMQRLTSWVPWALVALILVYAAIAGDSTRDKVIGFAGAVLVTGVALRAARLRLLLGEDVAVVGWLGTKHYAWSEIEKFVVNDKGLAMRMRGGLELQIPAFPMGAWMFNRMRERMRADLETTLARLEKRRQQRRRAS